MAGRTDLLRGETTDLPVGGADTCLQDDTTFNDYDDTDPVPPGTVYWYLVRTSNGCGVGSYGEESAGIERVSTGCP